MTGGTTSVYLRDAVAEIENNTLNDAALHAVSLVGDVGGTDARREHDQRPGPERHRRPSGRRTSDRDGWDNDTSRLGGHHALPGDAQAVRCSR